MAAEAGTAEASPASLGEDAAAATALACTGPDTLLRDFASRGIVVLAPEQLGIPAAVHDAIYEQEKAAFRAGRYITAALIPQILDVLEAPGLLAACDRLLGRNWAIVPFTHNTPYLSGGRDQHWHKDDNGPYNGRRHRHHQAVQVEMLYYPQAVAPDMGPTATVPYSQYWTFNHEENHDNFAGADHLDFGYQISGMESEAASGPDAKYARRDVAARRTAHDERMRRAVEETGWPLVAPFEAAPLQAGSVVLYSHNLFHRGNHRRDDWRRWAEQPRFMWRFWLYRTTDPEGEAAPDVDWRSPGIDPLTGTDVGGAPEGALAVWRCQHHWLHTGRPPPRTEQAVEPLRQDLLSTGEAAEPVRIGAAYMLAGSCDGALAARVLGDALRSERESVRRAAVYGLVALGEDAAGVLLEAAAAPLKWVRKAAVFGLGNAAPLNEPVLAAIVQRLLNDDSVYVRSVAADAIGCLARRAVAAGVGLALIPRCAEALTRCLGQEQNRLGMNIAQRRSIKFVRPTDECDVCEGIGIDYGMARFSRVRSIVRENALLSLVVLCSHGAHRLGEHRQRTVETLTSVVRGDDNVFSAGSALDALCRLAHLGEGDAELADLVDALVAEMPINSWEPLLRSGLDRAEVARHPGAEIERP